MLTKLHTILNHYLNPVHIYCRLIDMGMDRKTAMVWCKRYEFIIYCKRRV